MGLGCGTVAGTRGLGDADSVCCYRGVGKLAECPAWAGRGQAQWWGAHPVHRRPLGSWSIALRQRSRPMSRVPRLDLLLLSSLIPRRGMKD